MLKIRLRRQGAKFQPHYRVVVADARAPRDGRFVTVVGYYDPRTEPSTIHLDVPAIEDWVRKGAQPTDAVLRLIGQAGVGSELLAKLQKKGAGQGGAMATSNGATASTTVDDAAPAAAVAPTPDIAAVAPTPGTAAATTAVDADAMAADTDTEA